MVCAIVLIEKPLWIGTMDPIFATFAWNATRIRHGKLTVNFWPKVSLADAKLFACYFPIIFMRFFPYSISKCCKEWNLVFQFAVTIHHSSILACLSVKLFSHLPLLCRFFLCTMCDLFFYCFFLFISLFRCFCILHISFLYIL